MTRSDLGRYNGAITYITKNIDADLSKDIDLQITDKKSAGKAI